MTNHIRGSSLLQARNHHHHLHSHHHARSPDESDGGRNHIRSPEDQLQNRQVVVVQTVSIVQIINEKGAVIGVSTLVPDPVTQLPDPQAAVTPLFNALDNALPTGLAPGVASPDGTPSPIIPDVPESTSSDSLPSISSQESLTSAPLPTASEFPTLSSGIFNSTTRLPSLFTNSTALFTNSTRTTLLRSNYTATTSKTRSSSNTLTSVFIVPTAGSDGSVGDNVGVGGAPTAFAPIAAPSDAPPSDSGLTPAAQKTVIGGVVGSVAGVALIALALMWLLKWKRGRGGGLMLLGDSDSARGGRGPASGGNGGGGMGERSIPFAVPAALASLTGHKRAIEDSARAPATTGERGFYRVSGKKLISVLESGGDGYSDPHDSIISGTSDYRRSEAFIGGSSMQQLQLGSPMRPESGVPIIRSGPNRTPVQAQGAWTGPYSDDPRPLTPPTTSTDKLGRSLTRDEHQGSSARFSEYRNM